jgi:hypothetical protein
MSEQESDPNTESQRFYINKMHKKEQGQNFSPQKLKKKIKLKIK